MHFDLEAGWLTKKHHQATERALCDCTFPWERFAPEHVCPVTSRKMGWGGFTDNDPPYGIGLGFKPGQPVSRVFAHETGHVFDKVRLYSGLKPGEYPDFKRDRRRWMDLMGQKDVPGWSSPGKWYFDEPEERFAECFKFAFYVPEDKWPKKYRLWVPRIRDDVLSLVP